MATIAGLLALLVVALTAVSATETNGLKRHTIAVQGLASDGPAIMPTPEPTPTPVPPTPTPEPTQDAPVLGFRGEVTHYGTGFNGQTMGCPPYDEYWTWNTTIAAIGPADYGRWPCGTQFTITGPAGSINVVRQDSCPGCGANHIDLSEAGMLAACGYLGRCPVWIEVRR